MQIIFRLSISVSHLVRWRIDPSGGCFPYTSNRCQILPEGITMVTFRFPRFFTSLNTHTHTHTNMYKNNVKKSKNEMFRVTTNIWQFNLTGYVATTCMILKSVSRSTTDDKVPKGRAWDRREVKIKIISISRQQNRLILYDHVTIIRTLET